MESDRRSGEMWNGATVEARARAAISVVDEQRRRAAERLATPWWYHPALGLLLGGLLAAQAAHSAVVGAVAVGLVGLGVGVLVGAYRRLTGVWVSGYRRGPAGRVTVALVAAFVVVYAAAAAVDYGLGQRWPFLAGGAVVLALTIVLGRRFDDELRRELQGA